MNQVSQSFYNSRYIISYTYSHVYVIVRYEKESKNNLAVMFTSKDMESRNIIKGTMMSKQPVAVTDIGF